MIRYVVGWQRVERRLLLWLFSPVRCLRVGLGGFGWAQYYTWLLLRHLIFSVVFTYEDAGGVGPDCCYATWSSLACRDHADATPLDVLCGFHIWRCWWGWVGWVRVGTRLHLTVATQLDLHLHVQIILSLRQMITSQFHDDSQMMTHKWLQKFTKRSSLSPLFWTSRKGHLSTNDGNFHLKWRCDGWKKQRRSVRRIPCS